MILLWAAAMATEGFCIGFDGGGSGSRVRLERSGQIIKQHESETPAHLTNDPEAAIETCLNAVKQTLNEAGVDRGEISLCAGLAGAKSSPFAGELETALIGLGFLNPIVCSDAVTSYMGASGGGLSVVAAIGTGSVFVAPDRHGFLQITGGEGFGRGDIGSGAWLGYKAKALGPKASIADYAERAPRVIAAFHQGDPAAVKIIDAAIAGLITAINHADPSGELKIRLVGGLAPFYRKQLKPFFADRLRGPQGTSLDGACLLARTNHLRRREGKTLDITKAPLRP